MQYFDPPTISNELIKKANISKVALVPVRPCINSVSLSCLNNVKKYITAHGGSIQYGWMFSIMGNIVLKLTAHAVVRHEDGTLLCVTPNEYRNGLLSFSLDDSIQDLVENDFLPVRLVPLVRSQILEQFISIERDYDNLRIANKGLVPVQEDQLFKIKMAMIHSDILELAKSHTKKNDLCFCGSRVIRKKCCP